MKDIGAKWAETFTTFAGLTAQDRILDVGCGVGRMAAAIGEKFDFSNNYFGFDIREKDIALCRANIQNSHPNFLFLHANIKNGRYNRKGSIEPADFEFPVPSNSIDFCFAASVFTHMFTDHVVHYCQEAFRVLSPGGRMLATFFLRDQPRPNPRFEFAHRVDQVCWVEHRKKPEKAVCFDQGFVIGMLPDTGFSDVQLYPGAWTGRTGARHNQDIIVAHKN